MDINNTAADGDPKINFQLNSTTTFSIGIDDTDDKFKIGTTAPDASTSVTIDASQNVGIGTTSPSEILDIVGNAEINGDIYMDAATTETRRVAVGDGRTGDGISRVDLIGDATYTDFGLRLTRGAGVNAQSHLWHRGTGNFYIYAQEAADLRFVTNNQTNMILTSAGLLGVGTDSPSSLVEISSGTAGDAVLTLTADTDDNNEADNPGIELSQDGGTITAFIALEGTGGTKSTNTSANGLVIGSETMGYINWVVNDATAMTLDNGSLGIGTTSPIATLHVEGTVRGVVDGGNVASFDRLTNDGNIVAFQQGGSIEGTISVSGTTISYNAFTGSHYAYSKEETFERGMLVSFNGINEQFHNNPKSEILYGISYTAKANDEKVAGVFLSLCESTKELSLDNPYQIMAVGNGDVWVTDEGGDITAGNYLISSSTVGHAMKDNGDYEVSHVFAKATESVDWSTVQPDSNGVKRKKIIVYFESFDKPNYEKKFREQQAIIEAQKKQIEEYEAANTEKLNVLEAKINALLEKETASK